MMGKSPKSGFLSPDFRGNTLDHACGTEICFTAVSVEPFKILASTLIVTRLTKGVRHLFRKGGKHVNTQSRLSDGYFSNSHTSLFQNLNAFLTTVSENVRR